MESGLDGKLTTACPGPAAEPILTQKRPKPVHDLLGFLTSHSSSNSLNRWMDRAELRLHSVPKCNHPQM